MMKRLHIFSAICVLGALIVGSLLGVGEGYLMVMGNMPTDLVLRVVLFGALVAVGLTRRPRTMALRAFCAVTAATILGYTLSEASAAQLGIIDAMAYFLTVTVLMIETFEPTEEVQHQRQTWV